MTDELDGAIANMQKSQADYEREYGIAHHGAPIITKHDFSYAQAMVRWIATARESRGFGYNKEWLPTEADIIKSRLFWRLRSGKAPLPHRPPTCYSCPWYEVVEELTPHWTMECWVTKPGQFGTEEVHAVIGQCSYDIEKMGENDLPEIVTFGPWRFKVWKGKHPSNGESDGFYIERLTIDSSSPSAASHADNSKEKS